MGHTRMDVAEGEEEEEVEEDLAEEGESEEEERVSLGIQARKLLPK